MVCISSAGTRDSARDRDRASTSARRRVFPHHHISQLFDLPLATTSVSHLTCPLPPHQSVIWLATYHHITVLLHYCITTSVSHLTCPHHHISQSFELPTATTSVSHLTCPLTLYHCITTLWHWSVIWLTPATTSVSHLTCPLPPHQSVIWLATYHCITVLLHYCITTSVCHLTCPCHHISQSFDLPTATTSVSHLTCPLPYHCITVLLCHCVTM